MSLTKLQSQSIDTNITLTGVITATSFSGNPLIFETNNVERGRITSDGKFGIGTTSAGFPLDVTGIIQSKASGSAGGRIQIESQTGAANAGVLDCSAAGNVRLFTALTNTPIQIGQLVGTGGSVQFFTEVAERARIDSFGRLLIGTSTSRSVSQSATGSFQVEGTNWATSGASFVTNSADAFASRIVLGKSRGTSLGSSTIVQNNDFLGGIRFAGADGVDLQTIGAEITASVDGTPGANDMPGRLVFSTTADGSSSPTERVRIDSAGGTMFGGGGFGTQGSLSVRPNYATGSGNFIAATPLVYWNRTSSTSVGTACLFQNTGVTVGSITYTNTATAYNTSSDYRLKENIVPLTGAVDRLKLIPVHRFNFIADPSKTVDGFLAHEAQAVVPECVTGTKDEVDDEGNPVYQGIDQSKLVPLLTAALQEALDEIESLKARLTAAGI